MDARIPYGERGQTGWVGRAKPAVGKAARGRGPERPGRLPSPLHGQRDAILAYLEIDLRHLRQLLHRILLTVLLPASIQRRPITSKFADVVLLHFAELRNPRVSPLHQ